MIGDGGCRAVEAGRATPWPRRARRRASFRPDDPPGGVVDVPGGTDEGAARPARGLGGGVQEAPPVVEHHPGATGGSSQVAPALPGPEGPARRGRGAP